MRTYGGDDVYSPSGTVRDAHRRNIQSFVVQKEGQTGKEDEA